MFYLPVKSCPLLGYYCIISRCALPLQAASLPIGLHHFTKEIKFAMQ
jgi:hypothetical protein